MFVVNHQYAIPLDAISERFLMMSILLFANYCLDVVIDWFRVSKSSAVYFSITLL